jgi:hypothetical protein
LLSKDFFLLLALIVVDAKLRPLVGVKRSKAIVISLCGRKGQTKKYLVAVF